MGIINLTPDSFSDGGDFCLIEKVLNQVNNFVSNGVDVIDLGAQSTRPGAIEIGAKNESKRLIPVSYTHLRAHETREDLVCRLLLEKKK